MPQAQEGPEKFDIELLKEILDRAERTYGVVHKATPATMNGEQGYLIWDWILFNELTFYNPNTKTVVSLFTTFSDSEMKEEFEKCENKYGS
jgi:hypothetical protein